MKIFLVISAFMLMACHTMKPPAITQGLSGYVYRESGNQMPSPNRKTRKPKGLKCDLYIYQPTTLQQTVGSNPVFTSVNSKLVTIVHSDSTGYYIVKLPAGRYSVFISTDKKSFFADESDGSGTLNPAEVIADKVTARNFTLRLGAVY
ncbi:hypothetical protein [Mucilaginibacter jinjuensis]|uniref:Carboxypeptidase family protein n=1 Tax=Mucilaginibacter jinjuensis TaxID=1176721 RepID=A0ABY7T5D7_9SPHI|nr:hypothetical protein [Mucilaginibacter jinjuensis]WCT11458.1 hypothetical protein PQO05_22215 [Mucilaginibacter jinjuensis]